MIDREMFSLKNQKRRFAENIRMENLQKKYQRIVNNPDFQIVPLWHLNKSDIDFKYIKDSVPEFLHNQSYQLYEIQIDDLLEKMPEGAREIYHPRNLWITHNDSKTTRVIESWELKKPLIPIIITLSYDGNTILISDGNHRLTVFCCSAETYLPVIVAETHEKTFRKLVENATLIA
jgi:hypothetical protein